MSKNAPIPVPDSGNAMAWLLANPDAARQAVQALNLLLSMQVKPIKSGISAMNQQQSLLVSGESIQLPLPFLWSNGVPDDLDPSANVATVVATVNLMLAGERAMQGQFQS